MMVCVRACAYTHTRKRINFYDYHYVRQSMLETYNSFNRIDEANAWYIKLINKFTSCKNINLSSYRWSDKFIKSYIQIFILYLAWDIALIKFPSFFSSIPFVFSSCNSMWYDYVSSWGTQPSKTSADKVAAKFTRLPGHAHTYPESSTRMCCIVDNRSKKKLTVLFVFARLRHISCK